MNDLSKELERINLFIKEHGIETISLDIDGTLYPMKEITRRWQKAFLRHPIKAMHFLMIRKKWEARRSGDNRTTISPLDVQEFERFLAGLLDESLVPREIREWLKDLSDELDILFLTDHGARVKLNKLGLEGDYLDCLDETQELKPHQKISTTLIKKFVIQPETHLHIGDRWTDESQAKLLGSYFQYLKP